MTPSPLIDCSELLPLLGQKGVSVVDASWHMPAAARDGHAEYLAEHIPGAVFFDIDSVADRASDLPHTLAQPDAFGAAMEALGINRDDTIIVYDSVGLFSAARAWWNLRLAGAANVRVLNGGLPAWRALNLPLESGMVARASGQFDARYDPNLLASFEQMLAHMSGPGPQIVDARAAARFAGSAPEPRAGLASGHIKGSTNVPFGQLLEDGALKPVAQLREIFAQAGVDVNQPIVTTCGSGVTAAVLVLALTAIGHDDVALYDGSWTQWGSRAESAQYIERDA